MSQATNEIFNAVASPSSPLPPTPQPRKSLIQQLNAAHLQIAEFYIQGWDYKRISDAMGYTPVSIAALVRQPLFQDHIARRRLEQNRQRDDDIGRASRSAQEVLVAAASSAAQVHVDLLQHHDPHVKARSATEILNRTFGKSSLIDNEGSGNNVVIKIDSISLANLTLAMNQAKALKVRRDVERDGDGDGLGVGRVGDGDNADNIIDVDVCDGDVDVEHDIDDTVVPNDDTVVPNP